VRLPRASCNSFGRNNPPEKNFFIVFGPLVSPSTLG
jgi:hypothetical protein